jgi:quinol monooxygenase YgiN
VAARRVEFRRRIMEIYITTIFAKNGHEDEVTRFYAEQEEGLNRAKGFRDRQLFRARPGTMVAAVRKVLSEEEMARHAEAAGPDGVHFVIIEHWDSVDEKTAYSRSADGGRARDLIPHLLPEHTHEYYEDITPS